MAGAQKIAKAIKTKSRVIAEDVTGKHPSPHDPQVSQDTVGYHQ
ncbi:MULTISPECIES: hypothetical protein [unclassified Mesorhizobium]|nr:MULTISPECIES: hypothetical protein [unclassified Mesorhizobium]